jgi:ER membrane protein complex subunit 7
MRAEFEEQSRKSPMNSMLAGPQAGSNPMGNFDVAGFLAGQSSGSKDEPSEPSSGNGNGNGGKKGGRK